HTTPAKPQQMNPTTQLRQSRQNKKKPGFTPLPLALCILALALPEQAAIAQTTVGNPSDLWREPVLLRGLGTTANSSSGDFPSCIRGSCCRLFRMPSAIPSDPVGLDSDNDPAAGGADAPAGVGDAARDGRVCAAGR